MVICSSKSLRAVVLAHGEVELEVKSGCRMQIYARDLWQPVEGDVHMNIFSICEHAPRTCVTTIYRLTAFEVVYSSLLLETYAKYALIRSDTEQLHCMKPVSF